MCFFLISMVNNFTMNELEHNVTTFIEENDLCDTLIALTMELKSRNWKDNDDKVFYCFKDNPVGFTRLYEKKIGKEFGVDDKCITEATEAFFNDEIVEKANKYADFFNEVREEGDPFFTFLLLLGYAQSGCTWGKDKEAK